MITDIDKLKEILLQLKQEAAEQLNELNMSADRFAADNKHYTRLAALYNSLRAQSEEQAKFADLRLQTVDCAIKDLEAGKL